MIKVDFFSLRDAPGPKWIRTFGLADDGTIFMPAPAVNLLEQKVFLCASSDGVTVVTFLKHTYYPTQWLKREWPKHKDFLENVEKQIREDYSSEIATKLERERQQQP
jgi:hypothetical protein